MIDGPAGEVMQCLDHIVRRHLGVAVGSDGPRQLARRRGAGGSAITDPRFRDVAATEGRGRTLGDDLTTDDHRDPVGEELRLVHVVRREQDGLAEGRQVLDALQASRPAQGRSPWSARRGRADPGRRPGRWPRPAGAAVLPERFETRASALSSRPTTRITSSTAGGRVERRVHRDRLADGEITIDAGRLEHDPDAALQLRAADARVETEDPDVAGDRGCGIPRESRRSWSSLRRWGRGARRSRPGESRGRCPSRPERPRTTSRDREPRPRDQSTDPLPPSHPTDCRGATAPSPITPRSGVRAVDRVLQQVGPWMSETPAAQPKEHVMTGPNR